MCIFFKNRDSFLLHFTQYTRGTTILADNYITLLVNSTIITAWLSMYKKLLLQYSMTITCFYSKNYPLLINTSGMDNALTSKGPPHFSCY